MRKIFLLTLVTGIFVNSFSQTGDLVWEIFQPFAGTFAQLSKSTVTPTKTTVITTFEGPQTSPDIGGYKSRICGYLFPNKTGNYTFYICSDDGSELWLSTNGDSANKSRICYASGYQGNFTSTPAQKSAAISLTAGQVYYIEALHEEGGGGDFVKVGWTQPGEAAATINVIASPYISRVGITDIAINRINTASGRIPLNSKNNILYALSVDVQKCNTTLSEISFKLNGNYQQTDIANFVLWMNDSISSLTGADLLGSAVSFAAPDSIIKFVTNKKISVADTIYLFLTADVKAGGVSGRTINTDTVSSSFIKFTGIVNIIGTLPLAKGGIKTIENLVPVGIKISKDTLSILAGYSGSLTALVSPDSTSFKKVYWMSDNTSAAKVDTNGKIATKMDGSARIIVMTYDSLLKDTCLLTVLPNNSPVKDLYINPGTLYLLPNGTYQLSVVSSPSYISRSSLVWTSNAESIATVNSSGMVTATGLGKAIIYATMQGSMQAMCVVYIFGINLTDEQETIRVYPVPSSDQITVVTNGEFSEFSLADLNGKIVSFKKLISSSETISVKDLSPGIYILTLIGTETKTIKIIKE